jgi:hypothetical protein
VSGLLVGAADVDITPTTPIPLAGFGSRSGVFEGVDQPLSLRAFWFSSGDAHALLVVADMLWWPPERRDALRAEIARRWPVPEAHVILHATHTHGGPQTSAVFVPGLGEADDAWVDTLCDRLIAVAGKAWDARRPARLERGRGTSRIGSNRRVWRGNEQPTPEHPEGVIDRELVVIRVTGEDDRPIAVLAHHACHPTTTDRNRVTADFPGVMSRRVAERLGHGAVVGFLQGTCGDINPRLTQTGKQGDAEVVLLGEELAADVMCVLDGPLEPLTVDTITARRDLAPLRHVRVPTPEELTAQVDEPGIAGMWARHMLARPERLVAETPMELSLLRLGSDLAFLAMDAEVTTPYGLAIKAASDGRALPLPYSNGMIAYVVTDQQLAEGGNEANESTPWFALPSPFAPGIEARVTDAIARTLG